MEPGAESREATAVPHRMRLTFLDSVRAAAALYVVLHHIWLTAYPTYPVYTGPWYLGWLAYGQIAVSVFIVVSGFSLTISPARHGFHLEGGKRTYLRRRAWRILPTYWAALALSTLVYGVITAAETSDKITLKGELVHLFLLQDVIGSPTPNGAFWSIAIEWQIYFLFPLFLLVRRYLGSAWLVAIGTSAVVLVYLAAINVPAFERLLNLTPQFVALFVFGMAAAEAVRFADRNAPWVAMAAASLFGVVTVVLLAGHDLTWVEKQYFWVDLAAGAATACLLASLTWGQPKRLLAILASRPMTAIGRYSYSIYCIHLPLLWLTWRFAVRGLDLSPLGSMFVLTAAGLPIVLAGSYLFSLVFEQPFIRHRSFTELKAALLPASRRSARDSAVPARTLTETAAPVE